MNRNPYLLLHISNGIVEVYHSASPQPHTLSEQDACRQLLCHEDLLAACQAALAYDTAIKRHAAQQKSWVASDELDSLYERWQQLAAAAIARATGQQQ